MKLCIIRSVMVKLYFGAKDSFQLKIAKNFMIFYFDSSRQLKFFLIDYEMPTLWCNCCSVFLAFSRPGFNSLSDSYFLNCIRIIPCLALSNRSDEMNDISNRIYFIMTENCSGDKTASLEKHQISE